MARIYGLNGILRGRQGNNVFAVQNGTQVVKIYQPVVSNPRSEAQQIQRVKFALAGKISGCTPHEALVGLAGSSKRNRRAAFVKGLVGNATTSTITGSLGAEISFRNMVFSQGSVPRWTSPFVFTASYVEDRNIVVSIPHGILGTGAPAGYGELCIVGMFDGSGSPLDELQVIVRDMVSNQTVTFRETNAVSAVVVTWIVPYLMTPNERGSNTGYLYPNNDNTGVRVSSNPLVLASTAEFGRSLYNYLLLVNPTNQSAQPTPEEGDDSRAVTRKK